MFKKCSTALSVFVLFAAICFGQQNDVVSLEQQHTEVASTPEKLTSINIGVLMGGGGLVGADLEFLVGKRAGIQLGGGLSSVGFGVNFHLRPYVNSQFVSVQYFHQGFGDNHYASYLGPMYVFRAKKIFQFGIGLGTILSKGPRWETSWAHKKGRDVSVAVLYNIGLYFPL